MNNHWVMSTRGDPLAASRQLLQHVWQAAALDGMVTPLHQAGQVEVESVLVEDPRRLEQADPFVPVMPRNGARRIMELAEAYLRRRLAAVLRACEMRALEVLLREREMKLENWVLIGVDCVACFPLQDYAWRVEKAGSAEALTRQVLRNARQGGISADRFRTACQMCTLPETQHVDLLLAVMGLPVKEVMLVSTRDQATADRLNLAQATQGAAPETLVEQHARMLKTLERRRQRFHDRLLQDLPDTLPVTVEEFMALLAGCQPCQKCLEACPVCRDELKPQFASGNVSLPQVKQWLAACAQCGMCEQACPQGKPLMAVISRLSQLVKGETV
jgi:formate dehydrogenase subunit beta